MHYNVHYEYLYNALFQKLSNKALWSQHQSLFTSFPQLVLSIVRCVPWWNALKSRCFRPGVMFISRCECPVDRVIGQPGSSVSSLTSLSLTQHWSAHSEGVRGLRGRYTLVQISVYMCTSIYPSATNDPVSFIKSKWQSELIISIFLLCFLVQWFLVNRSFKVMWSGVWADIVSLCRQCVCQEIYSC